MKLALAQAEKAAQRGEVPVGAVLVDETGNILSADHNRPISLSDPTAHAEILAIRKSAHKIRNYRLLNTTLYVTIEPCMMCMGAIIHARVSQVVFGARDLKWGAAGSMYDFPNDSRLNHCPEIMQGVCEDACRAMIQNFFRSKRKSVERNQIMTYNQ
ncbi:tRNA adenosine(34) deaminase TadA [Desulfococcaceae bacterium HSG8]|nr:tRNA adenosine(34) deaminase TadA [Desulfococcaceae bacterium HSG8]